MSKQAARETDVDMHESSEDEQLRANTAANALIGREETQKPSGPTRARRNPDSARNARFGSAEAMAAERSRRYVEYMPAINAYAAKTQTVRQFAAHRKGMAALRDPHRATLKKRITEMEAELKKARDDLAAMDAADAEDEKKFGDRVREGQEAELKVEKNQKFLDMEHDDEPEL